MSFWTVHHQHKFHLLGSAALLSLALSGSDVAASQICAGTPSPLGAAPLGTIFTAGDCVVTAAEQPVSPAVNGSVPTATDTQRLFVGVPTNEITIEQGAGIVNIGNGVNGSTILSQFQTGGTTNIINNDGFLASDSDQGGTVLVNQDKALTINNGTKAGSTASTAVITSFASTGTFPTLLVSRLAGVPPSFGELVINQGSANSSGSITRSGATLGASAVAVLNRTGGVSINNRNGTISGPTALLLSTGGAVSITNGIDANSKGTIAATEANGPAVFVGATNLAGVTSQTPSSLTITNNTGSEIVANMGGGSAIFVTDLVPGGMENTILNRGTIDGTDGFAVVHAPIGASAGINVINEGTMNGEVFLGDNEDKFTFNGGVLTGSVLANSGAGMVDVTADSRINGAIVNSTGASLGDRDSVDIALNFGTLTLKNDAALTVGHDPTNAALANNIFFSQLSTDIRTTQNGTGTVNYLFAADVNQSVGTSSAGLRAVNFVSGSSQLRTSGLSYHVANTTIGSGAKLTLVPDTGFASHAGVLKPGNGNIVSGNVTVNGTLDLGSGTLGITAGPGGARGDFTTAAGSQIHTTITSDGPNDSRSGQTPATVTGSENLGQVINAGQTTLASGTTVVLKIAPNVAVSDGARYNFITSGGENGGAPAILGDGVKVASADGNNFGIFRGDSLLINGLAADIYLVANPDAAAGGLLGSIVKGGSVSELVSTFVEFASKTGRVEGQRLFSALLSIPSTAEIQNALAQLSPATSGGASQGASAAQGAASSAVGGRADIVQAALTGEETGLAAGDEAMQPIGVWGQAYGFNALQDRRRNVEGFSAVGGGLVVGADTEVTDNLVLGAALSYGETQVDGRGVLSNNRTEVDSYQASLYSVFQGDPWYVKAQAAYAFQEIDSRRSVTVGALSERPTAEFDGHVISAGVSAGLPLSLDEFTLTPNVSLDYVYSEQNGYTERNAPTTALIVSSNRDESIRSGLGASLARTYELEDGGILRPEFRVNWFHEFQATETNSVARFAFGSTPFTSRGAKPAKDSLNLGTSLKYVDMSGLNVSLQYDAEVKDRYLSNTIALRSRWAF